MLPDTRLCRKRVPGWFIQAWHSHICAKESLAAGDTFRDIITDAGDCLAEGDPHNEQEMDRVPAALQS